MLAVVGALAGVAVVAAALAVAAEAGAAVAAEAGASVEAAVAAAGADVDETGECFIYILSLAKEALRRTCRWFEARKILPTVHRSGAGT
jgi:hypothetical protein